MNSFLQDAAAGTLPAVSFVDPNFRIRVPTDENDEHPGANGDIRKGQTFVAQAINAVRNGPNWGDSIIFVTYDEHGGFFDTCRATCGVAGWSAESGRHQPRAVCRQVESAGERDAQWWPELRRE